MKMALSIDFNPLKTCFRYYVRVLTSPDYYFEIHYQASDTQPYILETAKNGKTLTMNLCRCQFTVSLYRTMLHLICVHLRMIQVSHEKTDK